MKLEPDRSRSSSPEREWDARFAAQVASLNLFRGGETATDTPTARRVALAALRNAVVELARNGARVTRMRSSYQGEALEWNRLDFGPARPGWRQPSSMSCSATPRQLPAGDNGAVVPVDGEPILFVCHAIPAAITIAQAREMVGQPFLRDHEYLPSAPPGTGGPVHLIGCYGNVTDPQARRQLGFPDATVVSPPFGVWVADPVQNMQMLFLTGCVDSVSTSGQADRAFVWLERAGEARLASRARSRAKIVQAITRELAGRRPARAAATKSRPGRARPSG